MRTLRVLPLLLLVPTAVLAAQTARKIPGITVKDTFPKACVDCHAPANVKLSVLLKAPKTTPRVQAVTKTIKLKGKHPTVPVKDVPASCIKCHTATSKIAPPFAPMMHAIHLTGGDANHFLTEFGGECTHCHKLNAGVWSVPSGAEK